MISYLNINLPYAIKDVSQEIVTRVPACTRYVRVSEREIESECVFVRVYHSQETVTRVPARTRYVHVCVCLYVCMYVCTYVLRPH